MTDYAKALSKAIAWSSCLLEDKLDRGGQPYILHPVYVMNQVIHLGLDYAILGICHDCPEDCFPTIEEGLEAFRRNVIDDEDLIRDLDRLSHYSDESYAAYIKGIKFSSRATKVKLVDLEHNSTITRLKGIRQKDMDRIRKYHASYCYLNGDESKLLDLTE